MTIILQINKQKQKATEDLSLKQTLLKWKNREFKILFFTHQFSKEEQVWKPNTGRVWWKRQSHATGKSVNWRI